MGILTMKKKSGTLHKLKNLGTKSVICLFKSCLKFSLVVEMFKTISIKYYYPFIINCYKANKYGKWESILKML